MLARGHVDDDKLVRDLLFSERDKNAARKSRERMIVQLDAHRGFSQSLLICSCIIPLQRGTKSAAAVATRPGKPPTSIATV
jgi:hypothetical protein